MTRPSWDAYGLGIAKAVSARADCTRRQVGAVVFDTGNRIVSAGYNGAPPGATGCLEGGCPRGRLNYEEQPALVGYDNCISNHAEVNALLYADRSRITDGIMYVTDQPCFGCCKVIANSGLKWLCTPDELIGQTRRLVKELPFHARSLQ